MQTTARKTIVDVDSRRTVFMIASARKPGDVAKVAHEQFVRNTLKDRLGWPRNEPAPESIKLAARQIAAVMTKRDKEVAAARAKARDEQAAKDAAKDAAMRQGMIDAGFTEEEATAMLAS